MLLGSISGEVILFSTARHTPSDVWIPMAVEPNYRNARPDQRKLRGSEVDAVFKVSIQYHREGDNYSTEVIQHAVLTFIASMAYSTWNNLPSGENVFTPLEKKM